MAGVRILGTVSNATNPVLARAWSSFGIDATLVGPGAIEADLREGDSVLGRLDVLPTVDGVESGLHELLRLEQRGIRVLNPARALVAAHDKLVTARLLARAGIPHPRTEHLRSCGERPELALPLVIKPRLGSWGVDVVRCESEEQLEAALEEVRSRPWFLRHGALVQELVPPRGYDLRLVVAGGSVIGAIRRVAAPGEWRTNASLGASRRRAQPTAAATELGVAAAAAVGADLVGVDLLPVGDGYTVVELNGAVDFDDRYAWTRQDVFRHAALALGLLPAGSSCLDRDDSPTRPLERTIRRRPVPNGH